jgi:hypothetical protein
MQDNAAGKIAAVAVAAAVIFQFQNLPASEAVVSLAQATAGVEFRIGRGVADTILSEVGVSGAAAGVQGCAALLGAAAWLRFPALQLLGAVCTTLGWFLWASYLPPQLPHLPFMMWGLLGVTVLSAQAGRASRSVFFPRAACYMLLALAYLEAGTVLLLSPSWSSGRAVGALLSGPLSRQEMVGLESLLQAASPLLTYSVLGLQLGASFLVLHPWGRVLLFRGSVLMHCAALLLLNVTDVSVGMLAFLVVLHSLDSAATASGRGKEEVALADAELRAGEGGNRSSTGEEEGVLPEEPSSPEGEAHRKWSFPRAGTVAVLLLLLGLLVSAPVLLGAGRLSLAITVGGTGLSPLLLTGFEQVPGMASGSEFFAMELVEVNVTYRYTDCLAQARKKKENSPPWMRKRMKEAPSSACTKARRFSTEGTTLRGLASRASSSALFTRLFQTMDLLSVSWVVCSQSPVYSAPPVALLKEQLSPPLPLLNTPSLHPQRSLSQEPHAGDAKGGEGEGVMDAAVHLPRFSGQVPDAARPGNVLAVNMRLKHVALGDLFHYTADCRLLSMGGLSQVAKATPETVSETQHLNNPK